MMTWVVFAQPGPKQSRWLREQIIEEQRSTVFLLILGSPLIANDRISGDRTGEKSRNLILNLIEEKKAFFLIVSGELHFAEYTQLNFLGRKDDSTDLFEVVSSGLSHSVSFGDIAPDFIMDNFNVRLSHPRIGRCDSWKETSAC